MGRSGSQLQSRRAPARPRPRRRQRGAGIGSFSIGGSVRSTDTAVRGERAVSQVVDPTSRERVPGTAGADEPPHAVENVLTLLNAKYVGTPHLRFSLSPRPMQLLSVDPSDPNLWFSQLLQRRSSGIEGIQEFTAVVVVPRGENFCVNARLRRVCVLDAPPGPLEFEAVQFPAAYRPGAQLSDRAYPPGTPLEEFDVDLFELLPPPRRTFATAGACALCSSFFPAAGFGLSGSHLAGRSRPWSWGRRAHRRRFQAASSSSGSRRSATSTSARSRARRSSAAC